MEIMVKAGQLILSLSILIVLHELGHFIPARLFKTRVEKFYLFFNPWFSLFKVKKGETEWGLGWLPLGGYVKIAGMIDESMDKDQLAKPAEPWEFRAKPAWQRLIIMLGGVTVNFILGFFLFIMILWIWGEQYLPASEAKYGVYISNPSLLKDGLFQQGDKILTVDGETPRTLPDAGKAILIDGAQDIKVLRAGSEVKFRLPDDITEQILNSGKASLFDPLIPFVVKETVKGEGAERAGILEGDSLVAITRNVNRSSFFSASVFPDSLLGTHRFEAPYFQYMSRQLSLSANQKVIVHLFRNGAPMDIAAEVNENGKLGIAPQGFDRYFNIATREYGFGEAIGGGTAVAAERLSGYVRSLSLLFSSAGAKQIGGFGSIGSLFPPTWDWQAFWELTAFLSLMLAFMNLLPIPALDGGHVLFLLYEIIRGKAPNQRFLEVAQMTGMILLLGLILYANLNDVLKLF